MQGEDPITSKQNADQMSGSLDNTSEYMSIKLDESYLNADRWFGSTAKMEWIFGSSKSLNLIDRMRARNESGQIQATQCKTSEIVVELW